MNVRKWNFGVSLPVWALFVCLVPFCRRFRQAGYAWGLRPQTPGTLRWGDFSCARKVTKSAPEGGRTPLGYPPRSVALRSSLSGVRDPRLHSFPRRPPALCIRMLWLSHPIGAPGTARHFGTCAGRGAGQRLEHQMQAPIGGAEVRQVRSAKGRGPPGVGYVSMQDAGKRTLHRFCAPALGPPPKPSVSGFGGERTSKGAKRSFRRPWAETEQSGLCEDEGVLRGWPTVSEARL